MSNCKCYNASRILDCAHQLLPEVAYRHLLLSSDVGGFSRPPLYFVVKEVCAMAGKRKSYTIYDLKEPREGWLHYEKLFRFGVHYRLDLANFALITGTENPLQANPPLKVRNGGSKDKSGLYATYRDIADYAKLYNISPEFLVDEPYYWAKCYMAPHRVAFQALRNGMDLWDFYTQLLAFGRPLRPSTFYQLIVGRSNSIRYIGIDTVIDLCQLAGLELSDLFTPKFRRDKSYRTVFGVLQQALGALDDVDLSALAGIALVMARRKDSKTEFSEIQEILKWREETKSKKD